MSEAASQAAAGRSWTTGPTSRPFGGTVELDRHKLAASRLWAAHKFPYLSSALFAAQVISAPGVGDVKVDSRWRLYVDPDAAEMWPVDQFGALLVHHVGHLVRDHAGRAVTMGVTELSAERWTQAADCELNDDLDDAGLTLPIECVLPEHLGYERGRMAEEYFNLVTRLRDPRKTDDEDTGGGEDPEDEKPPQAPDHGSGVHGQHRPWEEPGEGGTGLSDLEATLMRGQVAQDIVDALRSGLADVPANWKRWAQELLSPAVDWRKALAAEVRRGVYSVAGSVDYTYRKPSRRSSASEDVILPSLERPVPDIAVVCDTSGSMQATELARVLAEVEGLLTSIGLRAGGVRVLTVDAAVHAVRRVSRARDIELVGGGGSDMGVGLEAAANLKPRPAVVVVLTDGMTPWPRVPLRGI
ncbi:MAG TPA: VWA-like domain-containing protein, partial [Acidimicrobiales bacterium]|nr:VWA-like domain-containing protein [Acidimicrobiales bacterium]